MKSFLRITSALALASILLAVVHAQVGRGGSEWLTSRGDAQRTNWIRTDAFISAESMSKPGFELQWSAKLDNQARLTNGLGPGVTANGVTLFVPMSIVTGSSNNVYALDNDTGYIVWQKHFDMTMPAPTAACPGGITSAATRIVNVAPAPLAAGAGGGRGGGGRGGGYRSVVGEPGEGVPVEARGGGPGRGAGAPGAPGQPPAAGAGAGAGQGRAGAPPAGAGAPPAGAGAPPAAGAGAPPAGGAAGAPPNAAAPGRGGQGGGPGRGNAGPGIPGAAATGGGGGLGRASGVVYVVTSDGQLHVMGLPSGKDIQKPAPFLPANANWSDPVAINTTLYATTSQGCNGAPNGVWAIDLDSEAKPVVSWKTNGGSVIGGVTFSTDGSMAFVAVGPKQAGVVTTGQTAANTAGASDSYQNAIVALDAKTLEVKDWYTQLTAEFVTAPMVFKFNDKDMVAAATKDGRVIVLDAASLGGANHGTANFASRPLLTAGSTFAPDALAMWTEAIPAPPSAQPAPATPPAGAAPGAPGAPQAPAPPAFQPGTSYVLVPVTGRLAADLKLPSANGSITNGGIVALKIVDTSGTLSLEPAWASRDITSPLAPIVVNGVAFTASAGKSAAVVYAFNAKDGKELWNSGKAMTQPLSGRSFWSAMGQVYAGTADGSVHTFGFKDERR